MSTMSSCGDTPRGRMVRRDRIVWFSLNTGNSQCGCVGAVCWELGFGKGGKMAFSQRMVRTRVRSSADRFARDLAIRTNPPPLLSLWMINANK